MQRLSERQNDFSNSIDRIRPAVRKPWLYFIAGLIWAGVGIMLVHYAYDWLRPLPSGHSVPTALMGFVLAGLIYRFGFSRLAIKNIKRIQQLSSEKICIFAFQRWSSYPLIVFMIYLGMYLRKFSGVPKPLLAVLYIGIGGGLFSAGMHYMVEIFRKEANSSNV